MRALLLCAALFASVALVSVPVQADLPIHCLNAQVAGTWVFERSADTYDKSESCGYHAPDVNALHFQKAAMKFEVKTKVTFTLVQPNQVHDANGKVIGHWTMVYDEGFEVVVGGWTYFAFNAYHPKKHTSLNSEDVHDYVSICDKTMVGWFHNKDKTKFGCYKGYQTAKFRFRQTESEVEESEVEEQVADAAAAEEDNENEDADEADAEAEVDADAEEESEAPSKKPIAFNPNHVVSPFAFDANENAAHPVGTSGDLDVEPIAFYELESITSDHRAAARSNIVSRAAPVDADAMFVPNYSFLEAHNSNTQSTWRAGVHTEFLGKRMSEMMSMLGRKRFTKKASAAASARAAAASVDEGNDEDSGDVGPHGSHRTQSGKYLRELSKLPKEYSWIKYDSPVRNQGECGSCYSLAAMTVYEVRLRIKTAMKDKTIMSGQDVLSCSRTNQGCEGGYPFLVGKHAAEYGLVPEACVPYKASDISCDAVQFTSSSCANRRYYANNYRYVGGYFGSCNELLMMKEIMRNGPVIVAFQAPSSLFYYTGGIFTGPPPKHEGVTENGVRYWEQTNHAVVAMGWGEENGHKYWVIKNTWGPKWGEHGYFRIQRGTDECGIESMATTFDVVV